MNPRMSIQKIWHAQKIFWNNEEFRRWIEDDRCLHNEDVTSVRVGGCNLSTIPYEIGRLKNLEQLWIFNTPITFVPCEVGLLTNITFLSLSNNKLTSLPPQIGNLVKLGQLFISTNNIAFLPPEIGKLKNLYRLVADNNVLTSLPQEIGEMSSLEELTVSNNRLETVPPEVGKLSKLYLLELNDNALVDVPEEIGNLASLWFLRLENNNLQTINSGICKLSNISVLTLHYNRISEIPDEISSLTTLRSLGLDYNAISEVPITIGQMGALRRLSLCNNIIREIPPEIGQLRNLVLRIGGNPVEFIPFNVARLVENQRERQGIYEDPQSVHNSSIQNTLKDSILRLLKERTPVENVLSHILLDSELTEFAKRRLLLYSQDTSVHGILNLTFGELLVVVWNRIIMSEHSSEIKRVLNAEITDSENMCFTGRISRLVNCLNGFDPLVRIQISANEQIGNVIAAVKAGLELQGEYSITAHKEKARKLLKELLIQEEEIEEWLSHI